MNKLDKFSYFFLFEVLTVVQYCSVQYHVSVNVSCVFDHYKCMITTKSNKCVNLSHQIIVPEVFIGKSCTKKGLNVEVQRNGLCK